MQVAIIPVAHTARARRRTTGIGNWQLIMDATTLLAVTTNCMLFALSSEQLMQWLPKWYSDEDG